MGSNVFKGLNVYQELNSPERLGHLVEAISLVNQDLSLPDVLQRLVEKAAYLANAQYCALGIFEKGELSEFVFTGVDSSISNKIATLPKGIGLLGEILKLEKPLRLKDLNKHPASVGFPKNHPVMTSFLGVPIYSKNKILGNLYLTNKIGAQEFTDQDEAIVSAFANAAGIAIENARLLEKTKQLAQLAERERIAQDLHDDVIQRIYAAGLELEFISRRIEEPDCVRKIIHVIDELDETISIIRYRIFELKRTVKADNVFSQKLIDLARDIGRSSEIFPEVLIKGPIDEKMSDDLVQSILKTLRELMSNSIKHSSAKKIKVSVSLVENQKKVKICLEDDGVGISVNSNTKGEGLKNLYKRIESLNGQINLSSGYGGKGTRIKIVVPCK